MGHDSTIEEIGHASTIKETRLIIRAEGVRVGAWPKYVKYILARDDLTIGLFDNLINMTKQFNQHILFYGLCIVLFSQICYI